MKADISSCYVNAKDLCETYRDASGMMVSRIAGGAWIDEDGQEHAPRAKKAARPAKAPAAPKAAKSPIKAAFKKTPVFKRINAIIGHDETLSAAILRFNEIERYDEVMTLTNPKETPPWPKKASCFFGHDRPFAYAFLMS